MTGTNPKQLRNTLCKIADDPRGAMNADDFRDYMLSFLFLRYLSDNYVLASKKELGRVYPVSHRRCRRYIGETVWHVPHSQTPCDDCRDNKKSEGRGLSGEPSTTRHGAEFHLPILETYRGGTDKATLFTGFCRSVLTLLPTFSIALFVNTQ